MDKKPKTALGWIHWAREEREKGNAGPHPAKPLAPPPVKTTSAADAKAVAPKKTPGQKPPAPPPPKAGAGKAGIAISDADLEDWTEFGDLEDFVDDFSVYESEPLDDQAPASGSASAATPTPAATRSPAAPGVEPQLPAASNSTISIPAGSAFTLAASDFSFTEADGHQLTHVEIIGLPSAGSLRFDHSDVSMGQRIAKTDIDAGRLAYIPARSHKSASHDSFFFKVRAGKAVSRVAYTMTIKIGLADG